MADTLAQSLAGHVAVVTGSSSGIGKAIALQLASAGCDCVLHARQSLDACESVASDIRASGVDALVRLADLAESASQDEFLADAWAWKNRVDIWVNNAGVDTLTGDAASWDFERKLHALWQVDLLATVRLSRMAGQRMREQGSGLIVNIGWDQARRGMAGDSGELFSTIKGAVMSFSQSLAQSLAPKVRVNCVAPGWIKTAWGENASESWQRRAIEESLLAR